MKHIHFYALKQDLVAVFNMVEGIEGLKYTKMDFVDPANLIFFQSATDIPELGVATASSSVACDMYLVMEKTTEITVEPAEQLDGTTKFSVDQLLNPDTVVMTAGGEWSNGVILYGNIGTASDSDRSQKLMKLFSLAFRKNFTKVKSYWIGPAAYKRFLAGSRLTQSADAPPEYDLAI